ncbi:sigma-70 family RNA polymerase sigma factor [Rathayibacter oskolensis]|nr:sigma-70 family RNA polymerase sigma factor [Rathayibacter oskolensis]WKK73348.1 sigma-70 family RNA polymerase sigma factor [Rathayibacter oskolensis]
MKRHQSILRAYAWRLTGSQADASDAVQNALITVWAQLPQLKEPASVRSWMMRIVSRSSVDLLRQRRPTDDVDAVEHPPGPRAGTVRGGRAERRDEGARARALGAARVAAAVLAAPRGRRRVVR